MSHKNHKHFTREQIIEAAIAVRNAPSKERNSVAKQYGMSYGTLYSRIKEFGIVLSKHIEAN
ncbi:hypothetical protein [Klebsiella pneumoniae]|uniref:hypothetical protein n=1 Tax=Klebsiella pneumoniae TaxID=573 RepID=UPI0038D052D0